MIKDERDEENKVGTQMEVEFSRILTVHSLSIKMGDYLWLCWLRLGMAPF